MTDKRSESTRPSARPPMPSIAPPTDDIDSEWGAEEEAPAAANVPAAPSVSAAAPPIAAAPVATEPLYPPAPEPPPARPSAPAPRPSATATPLVAAHNPLRKQTLLGMAPVIPQQRSEPPAATATPRASEPPRPSASSVPPRPSQPAAVATPPADNPLRKQTLLGMAPVIPPRSEPPATEAAPSAQSAPPEPVAVAPEPAPAKPAESESSIAAIEAAQAAAADAVSSDAPITRDVQSSRPPAPRIAPTPAPRIDTSISASDHELPELRSRRSPWVYILAAAAVLGGGVFLLRKMDKPPRQLDAALARPAGPASERPAAAAATPKADEGDDTDSEPNPSEPTEPEPLKSANGPATTPSSATAPGAAPTASAPAAAEPSGELRRVNIESDPPGARMFRKGKEVGTTPFTLEVPAGDRRSYELGKPGFVTRKVVIDGTKTGITIGLKPEG